MWALHERLQDRSLPLVVHPVAPLPIVRSVDGVAADSILPVTFSPPLLSARYRRLQNLRRELLGTC